MEMATSPYPEPHDNDIDFELDDQREHSMEDNSMIDDNTENMEINPEQNDIMFYEDDNELIDFDQDLPMDPGQSSYMHDRGIDQEEKDQSIQDASFEDTAVVADDENNREDEIIENDLQEEATNIDTNLTENPAAFDTLQEPQTNLLKDPNNETTDLAFEEEKPLETQASDVKDFATEGVTTEVLRDDTVQPSGEEHARHAEPSIESSEVVEGNEQESESIQILADKLDESTGQADNEAEASQTDDPQHSPQRETTPVNLHPVTIRYNGEDCWLFPPFDNTETRHVFLEDATLASEPFDRLLAALRSGLVNDQEMADHDELVFDIPVLGLHICEDSKHASLMSLSRVIDIYMMLSQNEGLTVFEPLYCELSTRVCLADQFAYVDDAAFVRRITYADFVAEQAGSPEEVIEDDHQEAPETENSLAQEDEQAHADTSTYHDAADDRNHHDEEEQGEEREEEERGEEDSVPSLIEAQQTDFQKTHEVENGDPAQLEQAEAKQDALDNEINKENIETHIGDVVQEFVQPSTTAELEVVVLAGDVENAQEDMPNQATHDGEPPISRQQKEESTDNLHSTTVQAEPEADEDLFADDAVELDTRDVGLKETKQNREVDNNGIEPDILPANDDFDFDNWSDDEQESNKAEAVSNPSVTPSKGTNGKRKLLDEEDDFLDLDVSTPEPKRSRPS